MINIRFLREGDIPAAVRIVEENYSKEDAKLAASELREMFGVSTVRPTYLVAEKEGRIVGLAGFMGSWMDYHVANIFWVNVAPTSQRQGIGKELVGKILQILRMKIRKEQIHLVLLTTSSPDYYRRNFGFCTLKVFGPKGHRLMSLSL